MSRLVNIFGNCNYNGNPGYPTCIPPPILINYAPAITIGTFYSPCQSVPDVVYGVNNYDESYPYQNYNKNPYKYDVIHQLIERNGLNAKPIKNEKKVKIIKKHKNAT